MNIVTKFEQNEYCYAVMASDQGERGHLINKTPFFFKGLLRHFISCNDKYCMRLLRRFTPRNDRYCANPLHRFAPRDDTGMNVFIFNQEEKKEVTQ